MGTSSRGSCVLQLRFGLGFWIWGPRFGVSDLGSGVWGLRFGFRRLGMRLGFGVRFQGFGFVVRTWGHNFGV